MKLPVISGADLIKALAKEGYRVVSQKGSHVKLHKYFPDGRKTMIVVPNHKTLKRGTLKAILKRTGLRIDQL